MSIIKFQHSSHSSWAHSPFHLPSGCDREARKKRRSSTSKNQDSNLTPMARRSSKYYRRASSVISTPTSPHHVFPEDVKFRPYPESFPTPPASPTASDSPSEPGLLFHIYKTSPLLSRNRTYDLTLPDKHTTAFHVSFPYTAFGMSSKPNILVQRGNDSGPVIGEVRFRSMFSADEIYLPSLGRSAASESTTVSSDGLFTRRKRVRFAGRDWFWRGTKEKAAGGHKGHGESIVGSGLKCTDVDGEVYALITKTASPNKVGRFAITKWGLSDREIEGLIVTGLAVLEKEDRGATDSGGGN